MIHSQGICQISEYWIMKWVHTLFSIQRIYERIWLIIFDPWGVPGSSKTLKWITFIRYKSNKISPISMHKHEKEGVIIPKHLLLGPKAASQLLYDHSMKESPQVRKTTDWGKIFSGGWNIRNHNRNNSIQNTTWCVVIPQLRCLLNHHHETLQRKEVETYWYYKVVASLMFLDTAVQLLDAIIAVDKWQSLQICNNLQIKQCR